MKLISQIGIHNLVIFCFIRAYAFINKQPFRPWAAHTHTHTQGGREGGRLDDRRGAPAHRGGARCCLWAFKFGEAEGKPAPAGLM